MNLQYAIFMNELVNDNCFDSSEHLTIAVMSLIARFSESTQIIIKMRNGLSDNGKKNSWKVISEFLNNHFETTQFTVSRCEKKYRDFRIKFFHALQLKEIANIASDIMEMKVTSMS